MPNRNLKTWIEVKADSDFSIHNIPFGVYSDKDVEHHVCTAIGEYIVDLFELESRDLLDMNRKVFDQKYLNPFIELGKAATNKIRNRIIEILCDEKSELKTDQTFFKKVCRKQRDVKMLLPLQIGDYTDFYSSIDHATNIGTMIRDPKNALMPNWKHLPVGYHGRASSICASGHSFYRPKGQQKPADAEMPVFGATKALDFELETAFVIGKETQLGDSVSTKEADDYIFGMMLFNDWSARDIQTWEYVPLGPFLAKNFASTVSPWVVTLEALEPFRVKGYEQIPKLLPYLQYEGDKNVDINLQVYIQPQNGKENLVCKSNYKYMYYTMEQQLAHHTVNGCNIRVGDLMASGTISGPEPSEFGSMMELTWRGTKPIKLSDGSERKYINDHDTVIIRGYCEKEGIRVGFGDCSATVLPAK